MVVVPRYLLYTLSGGVLVCMCAIVFVWVELRSSVQELSLNSGRLRIAAIDMSTIEKKYQYFIDINAFIQRESSKNDEHLLRVLQDYQERIVEFEYNRGKLSPTDAAFVGRAMDELENLYHHLRSSFDEQINIREKQLVDSAHGVVRQFILRYNQANHFDYIFTESRGRAYVSGHVSDLTDKVLKLLNDAYRRQPLLRVEE